MDGRCWRMSSLMKSPRKGRGKRERLTRLAVELFIQSRARFRRGEQGWEQEVDDSEARNTDDFVNGVAETERIECGHAIDCQVIEIGINF